LKFQWSGQTFDALTVETAKVEVIVGMPSSFTVRARGEVLPPIVTHDAVYQSILLKAVQDTVNGRAVDPLLAQAVLNHLPAQGVPRVLE
jgi:hypothetical protein